MRKQALIFIATLSIAPIVVLIPTAIARSPQRVLEKLRTPIEERHIMDSYHILGKAPSGHDRLIVIHGFRENPSPNVVNVNGVWGNGTAGFLRRLEKGYAAKSSRNGDERHLNFFMNEKGSRRPIDFRDLDPEIYSRPAYFFVTAVDINPNSKYGHQKIQLRSSDDHSVKGHQLLYEYTEYPTHLVVLKVDDPHNPAARKKAMAEYESQLKRLPVEAEQKIIKNEKVAFWKKWWRMIRMIREKFTKNKQNIKITTTAATTLIPVLNTTTSP